MLQTKIKASAISNLTDARYYAAWAVEWLGFSFDPASDAFIEPRAMHAIAQWIEGPKIVGEFGQETVANIESAIKNLNLDLIQLGTFASLEDAKALAKHPIIKEYRVDNQTNLEELASEVQSFAPFVQYHLLEFGKSGISWENVKNNPQQLQVIQNICSSTDCILSLPSETDQLAELLTKLNPFGINLYGSEEEKVGFKSFDDVDEILERLADET